MSVTLPSTDIFVLLVALACVMLSLIVTEGVMLRPSFIAASSDDPSSARAAFADAHISMSPPVVADLDGDGTPEVVMATTDGRLLLLSAIEDAARLEAVGDHVLGLSSWRRLPVLRSVSLLTHTGLAAGRRSMALCTGVLRSSADANGRRRQIVVAVTEDRTVLAFDHELRPLWEHSFGRTSAGAAAASAGEVTVAVVPHPIYTGDVGAVLVAWHAQPRVQARSRHADDEPPQHAPTAPSSAPVPAASTAEWVHHFDYFALEGGSGALRWQHTARDFHNELHGAEALTPQMDYRLDLDAIGGGGGGIDGRHDGERPWRVFSDSVLAQLPHSWRHPHDTALHLASFQRARRLGHEARRERATSSAAKAASGAVELTSSRIARGVSSSGRDGLYGASRFGNVGGAAVVPNVVVARRRHGLEVLHLYTGRTLTQLPLYSSAGPSVHADVNGDGSIDHITALASRAPASYSLEEASPHEKLIRTTGAHAAGLATSGLPVREALWNLSIGQAVRVPRGRHHQQPGQGVPTVGVSAPLLVPSAGAEGRSSKLDAVFLTSDGRVASVHADGRERWTVRTDASWRDEHTEPAADLSGGAQGGAWSGAQLLPSLTLLQPSAKSGEVFILAVGSSAAVVLTTAGKVLASVRLPQMTNAPPVLADFTGDGVLDIILPGEHAHVGIQVDTAAGSSVAQKLLFAFVAIAVALAMLLRQSEMLEVKQA